MAGKCPSCGDYVTSLLLNGVNASVPFGSQWKAVTYMCPHCNNILGCQFNPIEVSNFIIKEIVNQLKKKSIQ